jgi:alginate O-acetyltransferase complex protein AlgI
MTSQALFFVLVVPITWLVYGRLRTVRMRQGLLLLVSYVLYSSFGFVALAVLIFSSTLNYLLGRYLKRRQSAPRLWLGILTNVALLSLFKYVPEVLPFFRSTHPVSILAGLALPVGISFWTFQALSYLFDLYRGDELNPSFVEFLLYMAFWPTVLSGPICRFPTMLPQFRSTTVPSIQDVRSGMDRICIGLLMMGLGGLLASGIHPGEGLDAAFDGNAARLGGMDVWCLAIGYGFDLFFNFAGYSHLVIGAARLFGFELAENFNHPYLSTTPSEFWTRWHMSLSFWIRDYMFLPLVMLGRSKWWRNAALVISMLVFGLWHKGTALLALWGLYHGVLLVIHRQWQELKRRFADGINQTLLTPISWLVTFSSVCLGWILFRSNSVRQAWVMLHSTVAPKTYLELALPTNLYSLVLLLPLGYFAAIWLLQKRLVTWVPPAEVRAALYAVAVYIGVLHAAQTQAFIYFQF